MVIIYEVNTPPAVNPATLNYFKQLNITIISKFHIVMVIFSAIRPEGHISYMSEQIPN